MGTVVRTTSKVGGIRIETSRMRNQSLRDTEHIHQNKKQSLQTTLSSTRDHKKVSGMFKTQFVPSRNLKCIYGGKLTHQTNFMKLDRIQVERQRSSEDKGNYESLRSLQVMFTQRPPS